MIKYVTKDQVELNVLLSILLHARRHIEVYTSRAADSGSTERRARHLMHRTNNKIDNELTDTFAAELILDHPADDSSETFVVWDPWDAVKFANSLNRDPDAVDLGPDPHQVDVFDEDDELGNEAPLPASEAMVEIGGDRRVASELDVDRHVGSAKPSLGSIGRAKPRSARADQGTRAIPERYHLVRYR